MRGGVAQECRSEATFGPRPRCQEGLYSFAPKYREQPAARGGAIFGANDVGLSGQRGTRDEAVSDAEQMIDRALL
jgi:hypothetical protein